MLMSVQACLTHPSQISISRETSLRVSLKKAENQANKISGLKKSQLLTHSRKTMIKNVSSETFETDQMIKSFEKVFDENQFCGLQSNPCLSKRPNQRWSLSRNSEAGKTRQFQPQTLKKHRKTLSINHRPSIRENGMKTQSSLQNDLFPISLENFMKQLKSEKLSLSRSIQIPQPQTLTVNQFMANKFRSRRKYENSKIVRRNLLPSFVDFSISKCQLHEKIMATTISSNLFQKHEFFFDTKSAKN